MSRSDAFPPIDGVLLLGHGGPCSPGEVEGYVRRVLGTAPGGAARFKGAVEQYGAIGGRSPFNRWVARQAAALRRALGDRGSSLPVSAGFLYAEPFIPDALLEASHLGLRHLLAVVLVPFQSASSWGRYRRKLDAALAEGTSPMPRVTCLEPWSAEAGHVEAVADGVREAWRSLGSPDPGRVRRIFTTHAIPLEDARRSPYAEQLAHAAGAVSMRLGWSGHALAYQSCPSGAAGLWTGPRIGEAIQDAARSGAEAVLVCPLGFLCDNKEILYDLDIVARREATALGLGFARAGTVGDHPAFIRMLADLIARRSSVGATA